MVAVLAGCSVLVGEGAGGVPSGGVPSGGAVPSATSWAPPTASPTPSTVPSIDAGPLPTLAIPSADPGDEGLRYENTTIRGRSGGASWQIRVPVFSGASVATEVNRRVRAAVDDLIRQVKREARGDGRAKRTLTGDGVVVTNDGRTAQVTIVFVDNLAGTAHPSNYVTTTVVDVRAARPVLLSQVIQNPPEGLRYLRSQVIKVAKKKGEPVEEDGLAPKLANWANWQATADGITFSFPDYQLGGYGLRHYTVPWASAELVLSPYGKKLLR